MFSSFVRILVLLLVLNVVHQAMGESDVVILNSGNFEHLTQASTGATTGDWLVKFYAPWCGHCKTLAPVYENVATTLKEDGLVNVAEVDTSKDRGLASRFDINGLPTVLFISHGKVYKFKGPRTEANFLEFARGGYKNSDVVDKSMPVPEPVGYFGEITNVFTKSFQHAINDISLGKYMTINVMTCVMPVLFLFIVLLLIFVPVDEETVPRRMVKRIPKPGDTVTENADKTD